MPENRSKPESYTRSEFLSKVLLSFMWKAALAILLIYLLVNRDRLDSLKFIIPFWGPGILFVIIGFASGVAKENRHVLFGLMAAIGLHLVINFYWLIHHGGAGQAITGSMLLGLVTGIPRSLVPFAIGYILSAPVKDFRSCNVKKTATKKAK